MLLIPCCEIGSCLINVITAWSNKPTNNKGFYRLWNRVLHVKPRMLDSLALQYSWLNVSTTLNEVKTIVILKPL